MIRRLGPIYDLMGLRLQDLDLGCPHCGKRLAEVIDDTTSQWHRDDVICIDCGVKVRVPPFEVRKSTVAPGLWIGECQLCPHKSMPTDGLKAREFAQGHYNACHAGPRSVA